ncbi:hypothetical protein ABVK25_010545 [Lepraria finkii]|uniref:NACHT domain-containing protein n=1 Tax=Lepraria finkii TaxID=1340010 RepID=A0ABR4AUN4_9LECA
MRNPEDAGFKRVSAQLKRWLEVIRSHNTKIPTQDREDCLDSLNDRMTRARIAEVHEAHEKTFHWLFDPSSVSFSEWLSEGSSKKQPIYWVQGKPGSGKSTLMKFAMRDRRMAELLASTGHPHWNFAAFFFHDRGSEVQKTLGGMLQELLHSVLGQIPALSQFIIPCYLELVRSRRTRAPNWDAETLKTALLSIIEQRKVHLQLFLLLDALDEHHGDNDLLASFLKKLVDKADGDHVTLKVCLASRSWTVFQQHFGACPGFAIHDYTRQDISTYIKARLEPSRAVDEPHTDQPGRRRVVDLVTDKALGVFIWVRLVVDLLSKGVRDGTPYSVLEEQVNKIPQELKDLYADTLRRIEPEYSSEAYIMLQIALCSLVPLPPKSFMNSVDVNFLGADSVDLVTYYTTMKGLSPESRVPLQSRLESRSGGLLEVVSVAVPDESAQAELPHLVVQFIHQTVKEYVQESPRGLGLTQVSPETLDQNGYDYLLKACAGSTDKWVSHVKKDVFAYARSAVRKYKEPDGTFNTQWEEALAQVVQDVESAMVGGPIGIKWFLRQQRGSFFEALLSYLPLQSDLGPDYESALLMLGVAMDFPEIVLMRGEVITNTEPMHVAAAAPSITTGVKDPDYERTIRFLAGMGYPIDNLGSWVLKQTNLSQEIDIVHGLTPLAQVLLLKDADKAEARMSIAKTLLALGADAKFNLRFPYKSAGYFSKWGKGDSFEYSLLQYTVCHESAAFVRLLLQYGAHSDHTKIQCWDLYRVAEIRKDPSVTQALLDFGVESPQGKHMFSDPPSIKEALVVPSHVAAASMGSHFSTNLFSIHRRL